MQAANPGIVIVTRPTRLEGLRARWGTRGQARFLLAAVRAHAALAAPPADERPAKRAARGSTRALAVAPRAPAETAMEADFDVYEREEHVYRNALERLERELDFGLPIKVLDRAYVPSYDFSRTAVVVVLGQDGLVANAAKYVGDLPIVAVNPDPERIDGVLLPFRAENARRAVGKVLENRFESRNVTLAEVVLNDGQRLRAFNDFFIGASSHVSARYTIRFGDAAEPQSSSGVLVSTGAGSTGWMSSVFNMACGVSKMLGANVDGGMQLAWDDRRLLWAVREPFVSKTSRANLVAGVLDEGQRIVLESLMPSGGVIFSDGIESDFLAFDSGAIAEVGTSQQRARLVVD